MRAAGELVPIEAVQVPVDRNRLGRKTLICRRANAGFAIPHASKR
jgi:hypothetical protein